MIGRTGYLSKCRWLRNHSGWNMRPFIYILEAILSIMSTRIAVFLAVENTVVDTAMMRHQSFPFVILPILSTDASDSKTYIAIQAFSPLSTCRAEA